MAGRETKMKTKREIIEEYRNNDDYVKRWLELEVQIDIRDQLAKLNKQISETYPFWGRGV